MELHKPKVTDAFFANAIDKSRVPVLMTKQQLMLLHNALDNNSAKRRKLLLVGIAVAGTAILLMVIVGIWHLATSNYRPAPLPDSPVPANVISNVSFPVYYTDQRNLPLGYTLDANSFSSPRKGIVIYTVTTPSGKKLIFSEQEKPSKNDLQTFYREQIPLHFTWRTPVGTAIYGIIRKQTFVSLPIDKTNTWILVTGPEKINQNELKQAIYSIGPQNY